jgi:predicted nuclease of restriction endonuclease-like (RecB) superfamily
MMTLPSVPDGYPAWLADLKDRIREARLRASLAVNAELIGLYWRIGRDILERQNAQGWGRKIVDRLANDLRAEFPDARGFSRANLFFMRALAEAWPDEAIVLRVVRQLPWGHNIDLLAVKDPAIRLWYAEAVIEHGWSRPVLAAQMDSQLHVRQAQAVTNFARTLPPETSELAQQILKDPYHFDFLSIAETAHERAVEEGLIARIRDFLLELGKGFAFVASQHHIEIGEQDFYVDLLFYHRKLKCLVAVDLKSGAFMPEHAGKMNFYLAALDDLDREPGDNPSIGLILCRQHNRVVVEYALRGVAAPIGVARYEQGRSRALPADLAGALPTAEELEPILREDTASDDA